MEKLLAWAILFIPAAALAQPWRAGGGVPPGGGPRPGGGLEPPAALDDLVAQGDMARDRVGYAADLLYPAAESVFAVVAEVRAFPALSTTWDGVNAALADAFDEEELAAAERDFAVYVREFGECRAAFEGAWENKDERKEICRLSAASPVVLLSAREDVEAAVEISKDAKEDLKELAEHLKDMKDMPPGMPGTSPGGAPPKLRYSLAAELEAMEDAKARAEEQIELGEDLLKKLDKML